jgi:hypothetical protein
MTNAIRFTLCLVLSLPAFAAEPLKVDDFAPRAAGIALVEVVAIEKYDDRPADGDAGLRFKFKLIRGSGEVPGSVTVITARGGLIPPGSVSKPTKRPKPSAPVTVDALKKGERYWFAFASSHEWEKYSQGVIGFWPEKDAKADALEAAVKADAYRWRPQYDPQTNLAYGHVREKGKWRVRVERDERVLWEHEIPGTKVDSYTSWGLSHSTGGELAVAMPKGGKLLLAETDTRLEKDNEFQLAAGTYWVKTGFDPETGKRLAAWVRKPQHSHVPLVNRAYDPGTGKPRYEQRLDFPQTGGKAVGAKTDGWYRKIERTFDAEGKLTKEETFRYDQEQADRWVKLAK